MKNKITAEWFKMTLRFCGYNSVDEKTAQIIIDAYQITAEKGSMVTLKDMVELGIRNENVMKIEYKSAKSAFIKQSVRRNYLRYRKAHFNPHNP